MSPNTKLCCAECKNAIKEFTNPDDGSISYECYECRCGSFLCLPCEEKPNSCGWLIVMRNVVGTAQCKVCCDKGYTVKIDLEDMMEIQMYNEFMRETSRV